MLGTGNRGWWQVNVGNLSEIVCLKYNDMLSCTDKTVMEVSTCAWDIRFNF